MELVRRADRLSILHVSQPTEAGVARVVGDLAAVQAAAGHRVSVACPAAGELADRVGACGADLLDWRADRAPGPAVLAELHRLNTLINRAAPDLVHLHSAKAGLVGRLALRGGRPTVFQPHCWSFSAVRGLPRWASLRWERAGTRWAHRTVCVSAAERHRGLRAGVRGRYLVIPNGVDPARYLPAEAAERVMLRNRLGVDGPGPLAVCVGRLCRQKGQDVLVRAWPRVRERAPAARLVLIGRGTPPPLPPGAHQISWIGPVEDPRDWYRAADVVVLPSRWEGMALAPLEAMASGRPVVLTDVDGARECLPPAQADAVVPVGDPVALADALGSLLADRSRADRLGRQARAHVGHEFTLEHTADQMEHCYADLLAGTGTTPRATARAVGRARDRDGGPPGARGRAGVRATGHRGTGRDRAGGAC